MFVARFRLLLDQRTRGRQKNDFPSGEPAVHIVHDDGCDQRFAEAGGQADKRVVEQGVARDAVLVRAFLREFGEHPRPRGVGVQRDCIRERASVCVRWKKCVCLCVYV